MHRPILLAIRFQCWLLILHFASDFVLPAGTLDPDPTVDECKFYNGECTQVCVDTYYSYYCTCRSGYRLAYNRYTCPGMMGDYLSGQTEHYTLVLSPSLMWTQSSDFCQRSECLKPSLKSSFRPICWDTTSILDYSIMSNSGITLSFRLNYNINRKFGIGA